MAVPKRFKLKKTKLNYKNINNNHNFIKPQINKYFFNSLKPYLFKKKEQEKKFVILIKIFFFFINNNINFLKF